MLKDIEAVLSAIEGWFTHHPVLGFLVMGWAGGLIAVLRMYERVGISFTWRSFLARCMVKGGMGAFVALLVYFAWAAMGWSKEWGYLVAGVSGVGGSDVLEALVVGLIEWFRRRAGLSPVAPKDRIGGQ
jgi:hypothetical protein